MMNSTYDNSASSEEGRFSAVATGLTNLDLANNNNQATSETTVSNHEASSNNVDVEMREVSLNDKNKNSTPDTKVDGSTNLVKLTQQLDIYNNLVVLLNEQRLVLFEQGIFDEDDPRSISLGHRFVLVEKAQESVRVQINSIMDLNKNSASNEKETKNKNPTILAKDVPIFDVDPAANFLSNNNSVKSEELSLTTFLLQFERVFSVNSVNIDTHWLYYLEIAFEKKSPSKHHSWFTINLKNSNIGSWNAAKNLLRQRFDLASPATSVHSLVTTLVNFCHDENESFILCLERFRMLVIESKVNFTDNVLLIYLFIKCFPKQVQDKINSILRHIFRIENSSLASDLKEHHAPVSWHTFENIISEHVVAIEEVLSVYNKQKTNSKKRKLEDVNSSATTTTTTSSVSPSGPLSTAASNYAAAPNFHQLRRQGICTYCKAAKYDYNHGISCEAKEKFFKNRMMYKNKDA
ncbi:hypothetical protein BD770DRAFT_165548 [Pilaira anomala]|nr:hypothetical protein BD770DRAFT_165548 [Pilaira anomala]